MLEAMTAPEQQRHPLENRIPPPIAVALVAACMWVRLGFCMR
jgi:hypothetical protein